MDTPLGVLAVVVGCLVAVTRLVGVASPELARWMIGQLLNRRVFTLVLMLMAAVIGSLFIWTFRLYAHAAECVAWQAYVLLGFGILMSAMALVGLAAPNLAFSLMSRFHVMASGKLRLLSLFGVIVGVAIILLGVTLRASGA
jgi:hypothetical protein